MLESMPPLSKGLSYHDKTPLLIKNEFSLYPALFLSIHVVYTPSVHGIGDAPAEEVGQHPTKPDES